MKLFESKDGYNVEIDYEIFLIKEFKDLYEDRKGDDKLVQKELAYIYFNCDLASDFQFNRDKEERMFEIIRYVDLPSKWRPDGLIEACEYIYKRLSKTVCGELLEATYELVDKVKREMHDIDLSKKDAQGKPIYNLKQMIDTAKQIPGLIEEISKSEREYQKQIKEASGKGTRRKIGIYE